MPSRFFFGMDALLGERRDWLAGRRIGLVAHPASMTADGRASAARLREASDARLVSLFGPEHGWFGQAGAGERCASRRHSEWGIPIHSLYGKTRKPTRAMLRGVDTLVFDLQDIGVRCYTYVSTLRLALEAAAEAGIRVVVADRPIPFARICDGPLPETGFESFVAAIPAPFVYGMTPGETALWLRETLGLDLDLKVAPMQGYSRQCRIGKPGLKWIPPSPAIRNLASALCYPATVCFEALGALDHGRRTRVPFQVLGAAWMRPHETAEALTAATLPGMTVAPCAYAPEGGRSRRLPGLRLRVTDRGAYRPALVALTLLSVLGSLYGKDRLWSEKAGARPAFFDRLFGTDAVRLALLDGERPARIAARWARGLRAFETVRKRYALYAV